MREVRVWLGWLMSAGDWCTGDSGDSTRLTGKRYLGGCGGTRRRGVGS